MITCDFSKRGKDSLNHYLYTVIKQQIMDGVLSSGEKLPSKRELADHLGVSVITVQNCYENLIDEGYIYSIEKKGFFVQELFNIKSQSKSCISKNTLFSSSYVQPEIEKDSQTYFADFTKNAISYEKFPFATWAKVSKNVLSSQTEKLLSEQPSFGCIELRKSIAFHLKSFKNMDVDWRQIVVGAGTEILYNLVYQLLGSDKSFAVENPGYKKIQKVLSSLGAHCIPVNLDSDGINICDLEKSKACVVHVTPSHHFPTGIVMPVKRRFELLDWALKDTRYIIEDDYDSEFRFIGHPLEPLYNDDKNSCVIYMNTFSKTLSPSFRISFMVLPPVLVKEFYEKLSFYSCTVSSIEQYTLAEFIRGGYFSKHITRMKNYYRSVRNDFITSIKKSSLNDKTKILEKNSGLHFLLEFDGCSGEAVRSKLRENGINIAMLKDYYYDTDSCLKDMISSREDKTFVINYSGISKIKIPEIVRRIENTV